MISQPLYVLGDTIVVTGLDLAESYEDYYYSYEELSNGYDESVGVRETYSYGSESQIDYEEIFYYSASDGVTIDSTSVGSADYQYDSSGRVTNQTYEGVFEYEWGGFSVESSQSYNYSSASGYELDESTNLYVFTEGSYTFSEFTTSEYGYTDEPVDLNDWDQRRDVTYFDEDGDGITDFTRYVATDITENVSGDSAGDSRVTTVVGINKSGTQSYGSIDGTVFSSTRSGQSVSSQSSYSSDSDSDGIINYYSDVTSTYEYDAEGGLIALDSKEIIKEDYDDDGSVDYVTLTRASYSDSSGKVINLYWSSNGDSASAPSLTVQLNKDFDGDGQYDSTTERSFAFTPGNAFSTIGSHVALIEDTFLATDSLIG